MEIPKGRRNKYEWDERRRAISLDRFLLSLAVYPTGYGFIPDALAEDGDPLDVMVRVSEPTFPGCLIAVKPIALLTMRDDEGVDDKILCVPLRDPNWTGIGSLEDLSLQLRDEISHFFSIYTALEGKVVKVDGRFALEHALAEIDHAHHRWAEHRVGSPSSLTASEPGAVAELPAQLRPCGRRRVARWMPPTVSRPTRRRPASADGRWRKATSARRSPVRTRQ